MVYGLVILLITIVISYLIIGYTKVGNVPRHKSFLKKLIFYHVFLSFVYYLYALFNPSDSKQYYRKVLIDFRGPGWSDSYGVSTTFIEWIGFPFIKYFGFTYEACMVLFSFFGFLGFIFFYLFVVERVKTTPRMMGLNLVQVIFLLPNLHFWSGSFGKGAVIFMAIGLYFYGLNNVAKRWVALCAGGLLIYHVRPHIMMIMLVSTFLGLVFSSKNVNMATRLAVLTFSALAFFYIYQDVLRIVGIEQGEEIAQGLNLTSRVEDLSKATSGVNISEYSLPLQVFTFLYRPLFFDAPGILGIIVSFENVFLLAFTLYFIFSGGMKYLITGDYIVKSAFLSFFTVSLALAQIAANLGLAIRQKSQVMLLFLFVCIEFFDKKRMAKINMALFRKNKITKNIYSP